MAASVVIVIVGVSSLFLVLESCCCCCWRRRRRRRLFCSTLRCWSRRITFTLLNTALREIEPASNCFGRLPLPSEMIWLRQPRGHSPFGAYGPFRTCGNSVSSVHQPKEIPIYKFDDHMTGSPANSTLYPVILRTIMGSSGCSTFQKPHKSES